MLEDLHVRMAGVVIECLDYGDFIRRYDSPGTLFYLDPPYWSCETDYGKDMFSRASFEAMAEQLTTIKGRFIMSINDTPEVRDLFAAFEIMEVRTTYSVAKQAAGSGKVSELLVRNTPSAA